MRNRVWMLSGVLAVLGGLAVAQPAGAPPAEAGVASFTDANGCRWQRVEFGETVAWAAMIAPDGAQLCDGPQAAAPDATATPAPPPAASPPPQTTEATTEATAEETTEETTDPKSALASRPVAATPAPPAATATATARPVQEAGWQRPARRPVFPAPGHYLQVGAFAETANAARTISLMQARGYDVLKQDFPHRGGTLRVLYAGPFADAGAAEAARRSMRAEGFSDAFVWDQN